MTLDFFFLVRDEGSWQEIGISIGHFAISNFFIILQLLLFSLSSLILRLPATPSSLPLSSNASPATSFTPLSEQILPPNDEAAHDEIPLVGRKKKTHTA
jgi:hypothetical protein